MRLLHPSPARERWFLRVLQLFLFRPRYQPLLFRLFLQRPLLFFVYRYLLPHPHRPPPWCPKKTPKTLLSEHEKRIYARGAKNAPSSFVNSRRRRRKLEKLRQRTKNVGISFWPSLLQSV